jgi:ABC-type spermidine/putrescine transport system permease subunit II
MCESLALVMYMPGSRILGPAKVLGSGFLVLVFVFLVLPIFVAASVSFTADASMTFPPTGFSMRWYIGLVESPSWRAAIYNTMVIGTICATFATVIGTLSAYGISRIQTPVLRDAMLILFLTPLAVPYMSLGMAMYPVFARLGLVGTRLGVALAQSVIAMPFVVIAVTSTMRHKDRNLEQAARTLGASPFASFCYVVLPLLKSGIWAGGVLAFMSSFDDVVMPIFLSGIRAGTVPKEMLDSLYQTADPSVMAASTAISAIGLLLFLSVALTRRRPG